MQYIGHTRSEFFIIKFRTSFRKMAGNPNSKNIDIDKRTQWLEGGIAEGYVNYYDFNEFKNIKCIGRGASGNVCQAIWENSNTVVALKSFIDSNELVIKEIVNEVYTDIILICYLFRYNFTKIND